MLKYLYGESMKNRAIKSVIFSTLMIASMGYSMESLAILDCKGQFLGYPFLTKKNLAIGLGLGAGAILAYKLLSKVYCNNDSQLAGQEQKLVQELLKRIEQEAKKSDKDFRFVYDYGFLWKKWATECFAQITKDRQPFHFRSLGRIFDENGQEIFIISGNGYGLDVKAVSCDLHIMVDIQWVGVHPIESESYKKMAQRHPAYFTGEQQREFDHLSARIKQEKTKLEEQRNYEFVTQKISSLSVADKNLFIYVLHNSDSENLNFLIGNPASDIYDYNLNVAIFNGAH